MANFLDDLSVYNAKAALVISQVVADGNTEKANMMSSLKSTANDTTLSEAIRLNALTALINLGSLLDIPLPPYFPLTTTYANTQTYVGIHDDLTGLQGGAPGDYQHITTAERNLIANAATLGDVSFANLSGVYTDNASLVTGFAGKQNALSGTGFVKISGTTISYDNSTYLSSISGIAAGGELSGTYPNPALSNAAVISKVLTGFTGTSLPIQITSADSILSAIQKLNNNIASLIVSPSGVASVALTTNSGGVFTTTTTPQTGTATLDVSLNSQSASRFLASPTSAAGVPTFRAFAATDLPNSGATAGTYGSSSFIPQIVVDAKGRITSISSVAAAAGGQVNTVTLTQPGIFGTVTNIGTASAVNLSYGLSTQTANYVWAGPVSGAAAVPAFRALVEDDIPSLSPSKITGLTNILNGYLTDSLSDGSIWIGNTSNAAVQRVMSGDVTISNTGVTTIGAAKVQYSMIQDVTTQTLLGRYDAVDGEVQQITLSGDFLLNSGTGVLSLSSPVSPVVTTKGDLLGHDLTAQQRVPSSNVNGDILLVNNSATGAYTDLGLNWVTMSGDATINATGAITIANGAVSLAKMANLAANSIIGNNTGSSATPLALTGTQVTAMLDLFSTSTGTKGLVPGSNGNTTYFLRGDLSWQPITGTGTVTDVSVVNANGFNGSVATSTSTPALTIELDSLNGVLKGTGTAIAAATAGTGGDYISPGQITQTSGAGSGLTMASGSLLGRTTASAGVIEAISVNSSLTLAATTLGLNLGNGNIFTVQQQMPSLRLNGSISGFVSFTPPATAGAQAYTLPTAFPGTGTTGYLTSNDAGVLAWASATGTTTNAVTFNNSGSGDASGTTFNGSAARTISYNTLGAQALNANLTGISGLTYASGTPFVKMTGAGTFALDTNTYISGTTTQYAVLVGGAGNSVTSISTSQPNKILISNGTSTNPGWTSASYLDTTIQYGILYSSAANVISEILPPGTAGLFLQWTGSGYTWASGGGGGGSGTVQQVSFNALNGFSGSVSNPTTTPEITLSVTQSGILKGAAGALVPAVSGTDYAPATSGTSILYGNGAGGFSSATIGTGLSFSAGTLSNTGVTSVGMTVPSAFNVSPLTITTTGTFAITGAGTTGQYVRGDGTLGVFPAAGGGGGGTVYYLNGGVSQGTFGGIAMVQLSKAANTGTAADFTGNTNGATLASFITDAGDPNQTSIPAGRWIFEAYLSAAGGGSANATVQAVVETWNSTSGITVIATGTSEEITNGTAKDLYAFAVTIPTGTTISATDRIIVQIKIVTAASKTVTLYTQDGNVSSVTTTFPNGIVSLNGLTAGTQIFANGTTGNAPNWVSSTATHTLHIPLASASGSVTAGLISNTDYTTFSNKITNPMTASGDIIYGGTVTGGVAAPTRLGIGSPGQVLAVSAGNIPTWTTAGAGDVTGPSSLTTDGNFAVFSGTGKNIAESAIATLSNSTGRATFNNGVDVGVSGTTTGTIVFRNGTTSATTTLQASISQSANLSYTWPTTAPAAGNILSSDINGNLSWTAAGAGNVTTGGTQTFTGTNTFNASSIRINNATNNGYHTLASLAGAAGTLTASFPASTGTVALIEANQTWTGQQTIRANTTIGGGSYLATLLSFTGTTSNRIDFSATPAAAPITNLTPSAGTRIVIANTGNASGSANSIGFNTGEMWLNSDLSGAISFYNNTTRVARFTGNYLEMLTTTGQIRMAGTTNNKLIFNANGSAAPAYSSGGSGNGQKIVLYEILSSGRNDVGFGINNAGSATTELWSAGALLYTWYRFDGATQIMAIDSTNGITTGQLSLNVFNTTATTINFAGAATTLSIGNTATAAQTVNMFTASTGASTYNFATGATANLTTKTINIGTGGAAGSTTNITLGTSTTTNLRFFGSANTSGKPTVTGSRSGGAAITNLLTALSNLGLITDSTTA